MLNGLNCDQKPKLSGILTEPLNPRVAHIQIVICIHVSYNQTVKPNWLISL